MNIQVVFALIFSFTAVVLFLFTNRDASKTTWFDRAFLISVALGIVFFIWGLAIEKGKDHTYSCRYVDENHLVCEEMDE